VKKRDYKGGAFKEKDKQKKRERLTGNVSLSKNEEES